MNEKTANAAQAQKMMVFVLSMSLFGLATLFSELIPEVRIGLVEFSVEYFLFIPLSLAMLLDPLSAALGAATGEIIFSEIMLGQFGGLGELEKFLTVTIGVYIAGRMVKDPSKRTIVGFAAILGVIVQQALGTVIDIMKVQFAIEEFEAIAGLPQSVLATEGFGFLNDVLFSGILFCMLPTMYLVPRLHGKIEPLMGLSPREEGGSQGSPFTPKVIAFIVLGFGAAIASEFLAESGFELIDWEADWAGSAPALAAGMIVATAVAAVAIVFIRRRLVAGKAASRS
jgi:hypothetical protein